MKNNNILLLVIIALATWANTTRAMHNTCQWNQLIDKKGNTVLHKVVLELFKRENNLGSYIKTYKQAIKDGADDSIGNNGGFTPDMLFKKCLKYHICKAIDEDSRINLHALLFNAPEVCTVPTHPLNDTPLTYAIKKKNLYAQACIEYCIRNGEFAPSYIDIIEKITDNL